jgi:hypothetical protein
MTDFRARGTIMGPAGLTAVFGMGTGGTPPVSSPEIGRGGISPRGRGGSLAADGRTRGWWWQFDPSGVVGPDGSGIATLRDGESSARRLATSMVRGGDESGWSSRSAVRTGRLRRSPVVHSRPIDLVVFQEPSHHIGAGNLVSKRASRLDAFSAYPFPTWLPGDAPSGTAGTPEVGPPQSSRTRGDPSQVSNAHGR